MDDVQAVEMARVRRVVTLYLNGEQIRRVSTQLHVASKFLLLGYVSERVSERDSNGILVQ